MSNRHKTLVDTIAAQPNTDDWSELERHHELQRWAKLSDVERVERALGVCTYLFDREDPALDLLLVPMVERLMCGLAMLRARDRELARI